VLEVGIWLEDEVEEEDGEGEIVPEGESLIIEVVVGAGVELIEMLEEDAALGVMLGVELIEMLEEDVVLGVEVGVTLTALHPEGCDHNPVARHSMLEGAPSKPVSHSKEEHVSPKTPLAQEEVS